jgi:uracil-DNA glycosylase family 4
MSKATFYEHFANKEECLLAMFDAGVEDVMREMAAASDGLEVDSYEERVRAVNRAFLGALAVEPDSTYTLIVTILGAGPRAATRRGEVLEAFAESLYQANARNAPAFGAPTFASRDDAYAVVGATVELVARHLRGEGRQSRPARPRAGHLAPRAGGAGPRRHRVSTASGAAAGAPGGRGRRVPALSAPGRLARAGRARAPGGLRRGALLGPAGAGFGDPAARVVVLGLAPAAHGGNRTGRVFTGDRSGDFLFSALHRAGFANSPVSRGMGDGLVLHDLWITAAVRCAPPANRPTPAERDTCLPWTVRELALLERARLVLCLGAFAWDAALRLRQVRTHPPAPALRPRPRFGHGAEWHDPHGARPGWPGVLLGCFHPSQQNTFTGQAHRADDRRPSSRGRACSQTSEPRVRRSPLDVERRA